MKKKAIKFKSNYVDDEEDENDNVKNVESNIPAIYKEELDRKLFEINMQIDMIGMICDNKMAHSYEEYNNSIKSSKAQLWDDLTKLNFKLIEFKKQNTKEDFINKLKNDLKNIAHQVQMKDKELSGNTKILEKLETQVFELKEEKLFLKEEIKNSKYYNQYLKLKLEELEKADPKVVYDEWINEANLATNSNENNNLINNTNHQLNLNKTGKENKNNLNSEALDASLISNNSLQEDTEHNDKEEKLEHYLNKNIEIIDHKINELENKIKIKYNRLGRLEKFNNEVLQTLNEKSKAYIDDIKTKKNEKISSKDIFFNNKSNSDDEKLNHVDLLGRGGGNKKISKSSIKSLIHKRDKREIMKQFLDDMNIKKVIYNVLYQNSN